MADKDLQSQLKSKKTHILSSENEHQEIIIQEMEDIEASNQLQIACTSPKVIKGSKEINIYNTSTSKAVSTRPSQNDTELSVISQNMKRSNT